VLKFIQATQLDKPYLLMLRLLTMVEHLENAGIYLSKDEHINRISDSYECSHIVFFGKEKIGTVKYKGCDQKVIILQIQIHPDFQNQGLGSKIINELAKKFKPKAIELTVLKDNPAIKLYTKLGFMIFDEDKYE